MDLRSLQHMQESKVHFSRALPARYVPPSGFDYPHDGFRPSNPGRLCFAPAAPVGFALRSVLLSHGVRSVSARTDPHAVCHTSYSRRQAEGRPGATRLLGFALRESLAKIVRLTQSSAGCSHGFCPSRAGQRELWSGFRPTSSHALDEIRLPKEPEPLTLQSIDQLSLSFTQVSKLTVARQPS